MGIVVILHRWLGIAFCLLFAMWFATGIVMHFVPFPSLSEAERFAGLAPIDLARVTFGPARAVEASGITDATRVRLIQRSDGPAYIVSDTSRLRTVRASDGADAAVISPDVALATARDHASRRGLDVSRASVSGIADYDQWSVPNGFDRHRPLFRIALGEIAATEIYVSSVTGEVVLHTTRRERAWNLVGSVLHWIYPAILRSNWALWDRVVWALSLLALIAAVLGTVLGITRIKVRDSQVNTPYRGWHALHHVIGLLTAVFVLTWVFSGWLSMDHGRLFSRGQLTAAEARAAGTVPDWTTATSHDREPLSPSAVEAEWFAFNGSVYRRDRIALDRQVLFGTGDSADRKAGVLSPGEVREFAARIAADCEAPSVVADNDDYPTRSAFRGTPVYRIKCGNLWIDLDSADGNVLQRLDPSRRAYRWLYSALHTLDIPVLLAHPHMRDVLIVALCTLGLFFSLTGIVIGWRRLRASWRRGRLRPEPDWGQRSTL
ncbi:PepSY domain-containing protein [Bradyrhizobium brasilense]|uniref:PepSY domain-containing protein n=1 Tax=Bradyrhizobium brasilense TaxID=1419277 RepID=UPI0024B1C30A|nr:PepSY domain-containing protein [Bradyrhizobium australafricanum]WFU31715.1 PepSY domain-containing protein [Bradyrhizobium australafricanum]